MIPPYTPPPDPPRFAIERPANQSPPAVPTGTFDQRTELLKSYVRESLAQKTTAPVQILVPEAVMPKPVACNLPGFPGPCQYTVTIEAPEPTTYNITMNANGVIATFVQCGDVPPPLPGASPWNGLGGAQFTSFINMAVPETEVTPAHGPGTWLKEAVHDLYHATEGVRKKREVEGYLTLTHTAAVLAGHNGVLVPRRFDYTACPDCGGTRVRIVPDSRFGNARVLTTEIGCTTCRYR